MPRRTYDELGYTVFRSRHVMPNRHAELLDKLAERWGVDRARAMELVTARWLGRQSALMPPEQDPDYFAVVEEPAEEVIVH